MNSIKKNIFKFVILGLLGVFLFQTNTPVAKAQGTCICNQIGPNCGGLNTCNAGYVNQCNTLQCDGSGFSCACASCGGSGERCCPPPATSCDPGFSCQGGQCTSILPPPPPPPPPPPNSGIINFTALEQAIFKNPSGVTGLSFAGATVGAILSAAIPLVMFFSGVILLIMAIISGVNMMTSAGDPQKAAAARSRLTNSLIGFGVILFAYWIVKLLGLVFGITQVLNIFA